jgi:hypothetical protein
MTFLEDVDPDRYSRLLPELLSIFRDPEARALCSLAENIAECDPAVARFIEETTNLLPNPLCPPSDRKSKTRDSGKDRGYVDVAMHVYDRPTSSRSGENNVNK